MTYTRLPLLFITLVLALAVHLQWPGASALADAPQECVECEVVETPDFAPTDVYGVLMHKFELAGDPPDNFVAEVRRRPAREARPEWVAGFLALLDPHASRVLLRPPRLA
ncbi:hypothetical protein [Methyloversatilis thermotolerans]|uniref:hypothetical protein n=1 Tax=Methyloversatilis thermotolerans TaxID=1346290 RepID=UPI000365B438|nr:hypothetical protein [Methyloversatilis thermotolerans]